MHLSEKIIKYIVKQMHVILSYVAKILNKFAEPYSNFKYAYDIYGVDFLITDNYHVYLMEINNKVGYTMHSYNKIDTTYYNKNYFDWICNNVIFPTFSKELLLRP